LVVLMTKLVERSGGKARLDAALAREEIAEDRIEKRIIRKADDVIRWCKVYKHTKDATKRTKYLRYITNKIKEYDKIRLKI